MSTHDLPWLCISGFMLDETLWDQVAQCVPATQTIYRAALRQGHDLQTMAAAVWPSGSEPMVVIGFSLGGYVARMLAAAYPQQVAALILVASSMREDTLAKQQAKRQAVLMQAHVHFRGLGRKAILSTLSPHHQLDEQLVHRIRTMGAQLGYEVFARQSLLDRQTPAQQHITCPTLIIAAEQDQLRSYSEACELQQHIAQAQIQVIADSGHMLPLEQPRILTTTIQNWLQQQNL